MKRFLTFAFLMCFIISAKSFSQLDPLGGSVLANDFSLELVVHKASLPVADLITPGPEGNFTDEEDPPFGDDDKNRKYRQPCTPDFPEDEWKWHPAGRPFKITLEIEVPGSGGEKGTVTAYYVYRNAGGIYPDYAITDIQFSAADDPLFKWLQKEDYSPIPGEVETRDMRMTAISELVALQLMHDMFEKEYDAMTPDEKAEVECGHGNHQYMPRVVKGICWFQQWNWCGPVVMKPCGTEHCCVKTYDMCYDRETKTAVIELHEVETFPAGENCPDDSAGPRALSFDGEVCVGECTW